MLNHAHFYVFPSKISLPTLCNLVFDIFFNCWHLCLLEEDKIKPNHVTVHSHGSCYVPAGERPQGCMRLEFGVQRAPGLAQPTGHKHRTSGIIRQDLNSGTRWEHGHMLAEGRKEEAVLGCRG